MTAKTFKLVSGNIKFKEQISKYGGFLNRKPVTEIIEFLFIQFKLDCI